MSVTIEQSISNYNKVIDDAVEQMKVIHSKYVCAKPEVLHLFSFKTLQYFIIKLKIL